MARCFAWWWCQNPPRNYFFYRQADSHYASNLEKSSTLCNIKTLDISC
jgi:hypothetical protein